MGRNKAILLVFDYVASIYDNHEHCRHNNIKFSRNALDDFDNQHYSSNIQLSPGNYLLDETKKLTQ